MKLTLSWLKEHLDTSASLGEIVEKMRQERESFLSHGMTTLQIEVEDARPTEASCDDSFLTVALADGRILRAPLWWYPRLAQASPEAHRFVELSPMGMHWPQIDEDISVASMLRGHKAPGAVSPERAL